MFLNEIDICSEFEIDGYIDNIIKCKNEFYYMNVVLNYDISCKMHCDITNETSFINKNIIKIYFFYLDYFFERFLLYSELNNHDILKVFDFMHTTSIQIYISKILILQSIANNEKDLALALFHEHMKLVNKSVEASERLTKFNSFFEEIRNKLLEENNFYYSFSRLTSLFFVHHEGAHVVRDYTDRIFKNIVNSICKGYMNTATSMKSPKGKINSLIKGEVECDFVATIAMMASYKKFFSESECEKYSWPSFFISFAIISEIVHMLSVSEVTIANFHKFSSKKNFQGLQSNFFSQATLRLALSLYAITQRSYFSHIIIPSYFHDTAKLSENYIEEIISFRKIIRACGSFFAINCFNSALNSQIVKKPNLYDMKTKNCVLSKILNDIIPHSGLNTQIFVDN